MKTIWILNHYATGMGFNKGGRHYWFAKNLIGDKYSPVIFAANTRHDNYDTIQIENGKYFKSNVGGVCFVFVKTSEYKGNGIDRIKNMLFFYKNIKHVAQQYTRESGKPDIILASSVHPLTWLAGYQLAKKYDAKFIAETRDLWPETLVAMGQTGKNSLPAKILYKLEKFIYKKADKLIFTFPGGKDYVKSIGLDNSKVRYINNGIDLEEFSYNKENHVYDDIDLDEEHVFKVLYTGSMGQANELGYLIKAAEVINGKGIKNIKFILFGDGYQREELEQYVKVNKLDNIIFKGKVDKFYIPNILSKSNLNVFTGKHINLYKYGLSLNKMFEYFASGKPTLSNIECGYDIIREYDSGITVSGGSVEALVEGILKFYNMPKKEYDVYCENALEAAKQFDFKVLTDKLEEIILELFDEKEPNANTINKPKKTI